MRPAHEIEMLRLAYERFDHWRPHEANVTDLRLEGDQPDTRLVITFTHRDRPGCEFGFQWPLKFEARDPQLAVDILHTNLDETIDAVDQGLPKDCRPGEITWL